MPSFVIQITYKRTTQTLNIRVPHDVIAWLDELVQKGHYKHRSDALRSLLREMVSDD